MSVAGCVGVIAALPVEAQSLFPKKLHVGQTFLFAPRLLLHVCGIGHERAHAGALHLIHCGARALVSWGTAGGLAPDLKAGKLILPDVVMNEQNQVFKTDTSWRNQVFHELKNKVSVSHAPLLQAREIIVSSHDKKRLFTEYRAGAVDMESAAIAMVAYQAKIKFMAVRCIVDPAEQALPSWLHPCLSEEGEVNPMHLMKKICKPRRIIELIDLFRAFSQAKASLRIAAALMNITEDSVMPIAPAPIALVK